MKSVSKSLKGVALLFFISTPFLSFAADKPVAPMRSETKSASNVDNSEMNVRDKSNVTATPQDQSNSAGDRKLLSLVRRNIVHEKSLSMSAHNIKIMTSDGVVTLRGPVKNKEEKVKLEKVTLDTPGVKSIDDQLDVKTN
ncbi:BON domain-containing protein [Undibacterium sp. RTI2.1]|uniref:BON domain-containing protein n=1 Tax=unclassified Undibacterium TaxID=2630295 RepID=UPI002AB3DE66|nr:MULTISPECIES: BON domain-containing protein [unclassified Undibacterium]MDY7540674.1 BON domain-containing protein [Undibacterium sp. 5I1]MEB0033031.1 BON domain-containing protein [Undibacterium sp. RTI2.1]MEB0118813.1 BON domain-containing protein [Undibacterium sp. RTI2.2]MEB0232375.1 BON domain-containing protein [Undibacterium sp. 10I3]MEB0259542.1 BON domain-containing protein [Undibacterium sp. 5I1]